MNLYQKIFITRLFPESEIAHELLLSSRYKLLIFYSEELWKGEFQQRFDLSKFNHINLEEYNNEIPPSPLKPVYFDWFSKISQCNLPRYVHPSQPRFAPILYSFCKIDNILLYNSNIKFNKNISSMTICNIPTYPVNFDEDGYPINPLTFEEKYTGLKGRGVLGCWGPNHTGDALITRKNPKNGKLQIVLIKRNDGSNKFAFPGGFVEKEESIFPIKTALRELLEEAIGKNNYQQTISTLKNVFGDFEWSYEQNKISINSNFNFTTPIYSGIVHDERNTDNAWIETMAFHWHLKDKDALCLTFEAGDDAISDSAAFYDIRNDPILTKYGVEPLENLFASHSQILKILIEKCFKNYL